MRHLNGGLRSRWKIERVEYRGPYYNENGAICAASEMYVELRSGARTEGLRIPFTHQAGEDLRTVTGAARDDYEAHKRAEVEKTREYPELLLDAGGEMAWALFGKAGISSQSTATRWPGFSRRKDG